MLGKFFEPGLEVVCQFYLYSINYNLVMWPHLLGYWEMQFSENNKNKMGLMNEQLVYLFHWQGSLSGEEFNLVEIEDGLECKHGREVG